MWYLRPAHKYQVEVVYEDRFVVVVVVDYDDYDNYDLITISYC